MTIANKLKQYVDRGKLVEFRVLASLSLTSDNSLRVTLSRLAKKGEIYAPARGVYVSRQADPFWVATRLFPGYVSLTTALYLHHLIDEYPFTVFVASEKRASVRLGQHEFRYFKASDYLGVERGEYPVASVEKAIRDSLNHADLVGYARIEKALYGAKMEAESFIRICGKEKSAFFQRLGYLLSILPERDSEKEKLMRYCRKRVRANAYLRGRGKGEYISEWKLVDNVGREAILSWWGK
ncbi:MAG: hypothetical protein NT157_06930 [Candidatus Micrarchaeota archaeon]|nr:hypothetical protein [Candidatus Micrarchaeota archaeon]